MIDHTAETVVSFAEACQRLPRRRAGKRPHPNTLYRWAAEGVRGERLETIQIGGTLCTSLEALQRFGCLRLAARISNLRQAGHTINAEWEKRNGKRWKKYSLQND